MAFPWAALASIGQGVMNFGSQVYGNAAQSRLASQSNDWSIQQWNRENAYNNPSAQVQRLLNAGLNPSLLYGNGIMNEAAQSPSVVTPEFRAPQLNFDPTVAAQVDVMKAQSEDLRASAQLKKQETKGKEIQNDIDGMTKKAFESAFDEGLVHSAFKAGLYTDIDDARMSQYQVFQAAWDFAILTGCSLEEALSSSDRTLVDPQKLFDDGRWLSVAFEHEPSALVKARDLFISGRDAQISANDAAKFVADLQKKQKQKDFDIYSELNKAAQSSNPFERGAARIALLGLFIAEQRFSLPSVNLSIDRSRSTSYDYSGHDHQTKIFNNRK